MEKRLEGETEEESRLAGKLLVDLSKSYDELERKHDDGPINLGTSINLMEDFFAFSFLCQLKRKVIYNEGEDSEDEGGPKVDESK